MSLGWGIDPWGLGPWGIEDPTVPPVFSRAWASSTHSVRVVLLSAPQQISGTLEGDALNPLTWVIEVQSTGEDFNVIGVRAVGTDGVEFDLFIDTPLKSYLVAHSVSAAGLKDANGNAMAAMAFGFSGTVDPTASDAQTASRNFKIYDVANPPLPVNFNSVGGTLVTTQAGDYANESGTPLLKKLILRRATTKKGAFAHLPNYGLGITPKELFHANDLPRLQADAERQFMEEPECEKVSVRCSLSQGMLAMSIMAKSRKTGETIQAGLRQSEGGVVFL